jgi:flagellar hook-length control protein FliK
MESWQVGQILNAMVISTDARGTVTLKVNEALIQAHIQTQPNQPLPTLPGQPLQLQVTSTGAQTVLKVINLAVKDDPIAQALRTALPRQADLTPLLTNIALLADPAVNKISSPLPQPIIQLAQQLFNNLTSTTQAATTAGLQHAVNNSGLFLESRLAHTVMANFEPHPSLSLDFKAGLLLLRNALAAPTPVGQPQGAHQAPHNTVPESPVSRNMRAPAAPGAPAVASLNPGLNTALELTSPALAMQIEGALARLQVNQIASLPNPQQPLWVIELPLRHGNGIDLIALHIEQDANPSTPESPERPWSISLELAPGDLGPLHARITLLGQQVSVTLWAEENTTAALANHNIGQLQDNLIHAGFNPGIVHCQQGKPPTILRRDALPGGTHSLVDTHA